MESESGIILSWMIHRRTDGLGVALVNTNCEPKKKKPSRTFQAQDEKDNGALIVCSEAEDHQEHGRSE